MARPTTAARRYAEAAFELASRDSALDRWQQDLDTAATFLTDDSVARIVGNPARPLAERQGVIDELIGERVSRPARNLVSLLGQRGRLDLLPNIAREYRRLLQRQRGVVTATVASAAPLTDDELAAVRARVEQMSDSVVELETVIDESLIGGLTVRIGDRLLDASVRGRLERLRDQLVAGIR
jgi:F-type H+-transporting ATPase subunit delta